MASECESEKAVDEIPPVAILLGLIHVAHVDLPPRFVGPLCPADDIHRENVVVGVPDALVVGAAPSGVAVSAVESN
jgi:hypothetical protein